MSAVSEVVLILEDNPLVSRQIQTALYKAGYVGESVSDRFELMDAIKRKAVVAVMLDLGLPDDSGISILRKIREESEVPVIIVTGRTTISDRVLGLQVGADDYVTKPFSSEELTARLTAVLRRIGLRNNGQPGKITAVRIGAARLLLGARELSGPKGSVGLTERETGIVLALATKTGYVSRSAIYPEVFGRPWIAGDRSLDVHIHHLRRKFSQVTGNGKLLESNRSVGYRMIMPCVLER